MREACASAPGKINLALFAGAPSPDGYHPLVTVFEALAVRETVRVRTSRTPGIRVTTTAYHPDGSVDAPTTEAMAALDPKTHLAYRAAKSLQKLAMATPWAATAAGLDIHVDKRVPVAGGMAGGSADAAAALLACNEVWQLGLTSEDLQRIGRTLGADVPACLAGGIALGVGRGDTVEILDAGEGHPRHHWAIAVSHKGLSTPEVFRALDAAGGPTPADAAGLAGAADGATRGAWRALPDPAEIRALPFTASAQALAPHLANDLQGIALHLRPDLQHTFAAAREAGALAVLLSGSGPSIGALAPTAQAAADIAEALNATDSVAHAFTTSGPVPGARLEPCGTTEPPAKDHC